MVEFFSNLFSSNSFMPHGYCFLWKPDILWMSVISDGVIATAYYAIPVVLFYFARTKKNLPFVSMFFLFSGFILLCGTTHILDIFTIWTPMYRLLALTKMTTAVISIVTALLLIPLVPKALALRSPGELEAKNKELETQIKERERAEKLIEEQQLKVTYSAKMSALGEMAGGVAHEINNPLGGIKSTSSQMGEILSEGEPVDRAMLIEMAQSIENTTDRIAKIVHGLRLFSRDGSRDLHQQVRAREIIDETLAFCAERFKSHGIILTLNEFDAEISFQGNLIQISQVILNLLNNAHDAVINLKEKWVRLSVTAVADRIEISVTDSGNGIPKEIQEKIFEPFFTTKPIGKGTGMGLSIAMGIIQSHQGELKVDSQCENTRFSVFIPKTREILPTVST